MPSGTISLPGYTSTTSVTIAVQSTGADRIRLSNDGASWGAWTPIPTSNSVSYTLPSGDGQKTVYAQLCAAANPGDVSASVSATTILDTAPPTGQLIINSGAPVTTSEIVQLALSGTDVSPIQMRFMNEAGAWSAWEAFAISKVWQLTSGAGTKTVSMQLRDAAGNQSATVSGSITLSTTYTGKWTILKTPDYDDAASGVQTSYFRLGAPNSVEEKALLDTKNADGTDLSYKNAALSESSTFGGWFEYTDGVRTEVTRLARVELTQGNSSVYTYGRQDVTIHGDQKITIDGAKEENIGGRYRINVGTGSTSGGPGGTVEISNSDPIWWMEFKQKDSSTYAAGKKAWRQTLMAHVSSDTYNFGDVETFFGGYKFDGTFGLTSSVFVGGKLDLSATISLSVNAGYALAFGAGFSYSDVKGKTLNVANDQDLKGRKSVRLRVAPGPEHLSWKRNKLLDVLSAIGIGTVTSVAVAGAGAAASPIDKDKDGNSTGRSAGVGISLGVAAGAFAAGLITSLCLALEERAGAHASAMTDFTMNNSRIELKKNGATVPPAPAVEECSLYLGDGAVGVGLVRMENTHGCVLQMDTAGATKVVGRNEVLLATNDGQAAIQLELGGTMTMWTTIWNVRGRRIDFNGGVLTIA